MANVHFAQNVSLNRPPLIRRLGDGSRPQRPHRARLLAVGIRIVQLGLPHLLDQHAPAREHLHEPGDDDLQQRVQLFVGGRSRLDAAGCDIGAAPVHPVQRQAVRGLG